MMFFTPAMKQGDEVKLTFADDGEPGVQDGALGFVETEEDFALGEDRRFRRVDILGGLPSSPDRTRPLKAMTRPCSSQIGNMSRPRKRS